tara:strand:+ start:1238 stop:2026 length:789 start_codon:yes stop_codon:yes gene_type:complete
MNTFFKKKKIKNFFFTLIIFTIFFSSILNIYDNRSKIITFFVNKFLAKSIPSTIKYTDNNKNTFWANEILDGGYILHFRHTERDKWKDVQMYDALESDVHLNGPDESRYAENEYFDKAVCLNERGKIQARAIGEHIKNIGLPIGNVITSVSCRSRQTAELAFGGYDSMKRILVHIGPYKEDLSLRNEKLKNFYSKIEILEGTNTIVTSHNSVVTCEMFENCNGKTLKIDEGGFFVISKKDGLLYLENTFYNYNSFNKEFYKR